MKINRYLNLFALTIFLLGTGEFVAQAGSPQSVGLQETPGSNFGVKESPYSPPNGDISPHEVAANNHYESGKFYHRRQNYDAAVNQYLQAISLYQECMRYRVRGSQAYNRMAQKMKDASDRVTQIRSRPRPRPRPRR